MLREYFRALNRAGKGEVISRCWYCNGVDFGGGRDGRSVCRDDCVRCHGFEQVFAASTTSCSDLRALCQKSSQESQNVSETETVPERDTMLPAKSVYGPVRARVLCSRFPAVVAACLCRRRWVSLPWRLVGSFASPCPPPSLPAPHFDLQEPTEYHEFARAKT
jgi:hypothetical protein